MLDKKLIIAEHDIKKRVNELGAAITRDYRDRPLVVVGILNGAFIFMADLARQIALPIEIDFIRVSSYGDKDHSSGKITFTKDIELDITGKDVLLVEDIVDTGRTMAELIKFFAARKPASLKVCALIDKRERREAAIDIDYPGFTVAHGFLVGYGLDYAEQHRHYPEIYHLLMDK
ncbi:MAG: hypoxanthine phosphoribosyltransferase [Desulfobulbaceae bacterium]|nr:hypoxanthine phosphoribosyltransferase [Desulfobulbaceae bacterium]